MKQNMKKAWVRRCWLSIIYYSFQKHSWQVLLGVQTTESHSIELNPGEGREISLDHYSVWNYNLSQGLITLKKKNESYICTINVTFKELSRLQIIIHVLLLTH